MTLMSTLELLAPAKNYEFGKEAVNHGADALYIGAPAFGARSGATNTIEDVESLVKYSHLYGCKVFATVNTILYDDELEAAVTMIRRLYDVGVDALIVQDMGLLECDLPPIELHASTQCHNASVEKIKFLQQAGFKRVILARETSLEQMREIRQSTDVDLEGFVHGALCVSYSGQCYMSQYLNGRSGNRGSCSQPCRSSYNLYNGDGKLLIKNRHLLSLKDFNASSSLQQMIEAGVTSFKIEGRLKDVGYVKNVVAHYRMLLDGLMEGHARASSGRSVFTFEPDVERTFNRGYTDYFLHGRQPMASFATQKSMGKYVGEVESVGRDTLTVRGKETFANGDGICYFDKEGQLQGFYVNDVRGKTIVPNKMPTVKVGTKLWRNNDQQFEKTLAGRTAERKIAVELSFSATPQGFMLDVIDEDGVGASYSIDAVHEEPRSGRESCKEQTVRQLSKTGDTPFVVTQVKDNTDGMFFLPASVLNQLRRGVIGELTANRLKHFSPKEMPRVDQGMPFPTKDIDYRGNVVNKKAEEFYKKHGASVVARGVEQTGIYDGVALMTTKYCLRYELGCCIRGKSKTRPLVAIRADEELYLDNNGHRFHLVFDCPNCRMMVEKA